MSSAFGSERLYRKPAHVQQELALRRAGPPPRGRHPGEIGLRPARPAEVESRMDAVFKERWDRRGARRRSASPGCAREGLREFRSHPPLPGRSP